MNTDKLFTLRRLSWGALCMEGDDNFPHRAEAAKTFDLDGDKVWVAERVGLKPGDVVVDVGAFVGDTPFVWANKFGCKVHAFEPFLDAFVCCIYNCRYLPVTCYNVPAGNGERVRLEYNCPGPNFGMRSVRADDGPESVESFRIDSLNLPAVKFMKIDCEGSEIPTLLGAAETIRRCRPILFVEMFRDGQAWRGFTPEQLEETIRVLGYRLEMVGELPRYDWLCWPE